MKLIIDLGNSLKKFAFFEKGEMKNLYAFEEFDLRELERMLEETPVKSSILCSVISYPETMTDILSARSKFIKLTSQTPLPIKVGYETPDTLGKDRLAAAVAGASLYPERNVLIVNAGTCITYDVVTAAGEYLGGAISPGLNMRYHGLNTFTDHLPLLEKARQTPITGRSTYESIRSGVQMGTLSEMDGMIDRYREKYEDLTMILSGGDADYFDKKLKNNIFAVPNIVLTGLNAILDFNV